LQFRAKKMKHQKCNQGKFENSCAVVLGGSLAGYSIITELWNKGIKNIILLYTCRDFGYYSNKIILSQKMDLSAETLKNELLSLNSKYKKLIIYPTLDYQVKNLSDIYDSIKEFCLVPFNHLNVLTCMNKFYQYQCCEKLGVPVPKTISLEQPADIKRIVNLKFPIIVKPQTKLTLRDEHFRNTTINNHKDLDRLHVMLEEKMYGGGQLLASEIIPGSSDNIYAYVGYRNKNGAILNEWTGRKLSQFPDDFGTFASATNELHPTILKHGRTLLNEMNLMGICEAEFKFDPRDNNFKFIEINLRTMLWNGIGHLSGVDLMYTQYLDGIGEKTPRQNQITNKKIHLVCLNFELKNIVHRKNYWKVFKYNLFQGDINYWLPWDKHDLKPFIFWFLGIPKRIVKRWYEKYISIPSR